MVTVLLALAASLAWGVADFAGGTVSRRLPLMAVTALSQAAGLAGLLLLLAARGGELSWQAFLVALPSGAAGAVGLVTYYAALSAGRMSIVSPIASCGALLPVGLALARGERPGAVALGGAGVALAGAVMASAEESTSAERDRRLAVLLAVAAAISIGLFSWFLAEATRQGDVLSALVGGRVGSFALLAVAAAATRPTLRLGRRSLGALAGIGLLDVAANGLYALAISRGLVAIVAVLGSLYPVAIVALAHGLLGERVSRVQRAGIALALAGVAVVATA